MKNANSLAGRMRYTLFIIVLYLVGKNVTVPWVVPSDAFIDTAGMQYFISQMMGSDLGGGSVLTLGLMPWMSASVVIHIFSSAFGRRNRKRTSSRVVFYRTMILALVISFIMAFVRSANLSYRTELGLSSGILRFLTMLIWTAGVYVVIWMSERNRTWGFGGNSLLVLVNILYGLRGSLIRSVGYVYYAAIGDDRISYGQNFLAIGIILGAIFITILLKSSEFRIPVERIMLTSRHEDSNYIAISMNPAGTMPTIYSMSFFSLPYVLLTLVNLFVPDHPLILYWISVFDLGTITGVIIFLLMFVLLTISLSFLLLNPTEIAERLQRTGDYVDGVEPGDSTSRILRRKILTACAVSCVGMGAVIGIPLFLRVVIGGNSPIYTMPITIALLSNLILDLLEEVRTRRDLETYEPFL